MKKLTCMFLLLILSNITSAEEDKHFILRKKIQEAKKKIEEYNLKAKETEERIEEFKRTHSKRIEKRKSDISRLSENVSHHEKELKSKKLENKSLERSLKNHEIQFALFRKRLKKYMEDYQRAIKKEIPYNKEERSLNVSGLITDVQFENITPEEIFNRFHNFLNKELLLALDSEVYVKDNIKYLRIGWILLSYSDDSGKNAGILTRKKGEWVWEDNLSFSMRKAIRDSIKMVEGKKAPDLINFPIPMALVREKLKGALK